MGLKKEEKLLIVLFFCLLAFRLFFSLSTHTFSDDTSYFNMREVLNIKETGLPLLKDDLSYSGRSITFLPGMHYLLAIIYFIFYRFLKKEVLFKIFMNLSAASIVIVVYFISLHMSRDRGASLAAAFAAGFSPVFISETINRITTLSISIPANFLMLYFFMRSRKERSFVKYFLITSIFCAFIDSLILIFLIALLFYLLISEIEELKEGVAGYEQIFFSLIICFLTNFMFFKNALLIHGIETVWQNVPADIIAKYFQRLSIMDAVYKINPISFLSGIYVFYMFTIREKKRNIFVMAALCFTILALLWLRMIELNIGLALLSIIFALLFGYFYKSFFEYVKKTKLAFFKRFLSTTIISLLVIFSLINSYAYARDSLNYSISEEELDALYFLRERILNESSESAVLSAPGSGHLITYFSNARNVMDSNFLLIPQINERYKNVKTIYTTPYETTAIKLLEKYNADFIYFSEREMEEFDVKELKYVKDEKCFRLIYNQSILIYEVLCKLSPVS